MPHRPPLNIHSWMTYAAGLPISMEDPYQLTSPSLSFVGKPFPPTLTCRRGTWRRRLQSHVHWKLSCCCTSVQVISGKPSLRPQRNRLAEFKLRSSYPWFIPYEFFNISKENVAADQRQIKKMRAMIIWRTCWDSESLNAKLSLRLNMGRSQNWNLRMFWSTCFAECRREKWK